MDVSSAAGGIKTSARYIRATQLFTRLVVGTYSFVRLLPGNSITRDRSAFWDWPTVACVARNLTETYQIFYYLIDPGLAEEDVELRVNLMNLHLNSEKYRIYKEGRASQQVLATFEVGLPQDRTRLLQSPAFQRLPKELRNDLLKGKKAMHLSHSQIGESLPFMDRDFRWIYRLLSNHVHTTPFSFQAQSNERGRGDENDAERFYITLAIQVVLKYVTAAVLDMARIFPDRIANPCEACVDRARTLHER
jgi:hypothetical protein